MTDQERKAAEDIYAKLKPIQEAKGYYFNPDHEITLDILHQLLVMKSRFGYMACPCRLVAGERANDADIICPCVYRTEDVKEFGSCYCGLYVDKYIYEGCKKRKPIPERRPPEKSFF